MTATLRPWSTQPITGAQHDAWMAEERERLEEVRRSDTAFLESQIRGRLTELKELPVTVCPDIRPWVVEKGI